MDGISALVKDTPQISLAPSAMSGYDKKTTVQEPGNQPSPGTECSGT